MLFTFETIALEEKLTFGDPFSDSGVALTSAARARGALLEMLK